MGNYNTGNPVKDRFLPKYDAIRNDTGLSLNGICSAIEEATGTQIAAQTAKDSVNPSKSNLNGNFAIAFCFTFHIDINELYFGKSSSGNRITAGAGSSTVFDHSVNCHQLSDPHFFGEYYGYFFNTRHAGTLDAFQLVLNEREAVLTLHVNVGVNADEEEYDILKLYGKPMHLEPDLIFIVFQQAQGDEFYTFAFNWYKINTDRKMYFRQGALLTQHRSEVRCPQIQSFLLTDREIPKESLPLVAGQLKLSSDAKNNYIFIKETAFDSLFATQALSGADVGKEPLRSAALRHECLWFEENSIRIELRNAGWDPQAIERTICEVKSRSLNPNAIVYRNNNDAADFIRSLGKQETEAPEPRTVFFEKNVTIGKLDAESPVLSDYQLVRLQTGEVIDIPLGSFVIGRSESKADYVIRNDNTVGRVHAILSSDAAGCRIRDNKSLNKTVVNGKALEPDEFFLLKEGDTIRISNERFLFRKA